ncbi:MAG: aquaporin family protein [Micrococcales bacterium]|nr:aquaporin family protein [Micrococcales bacterium]
MPLDINLGTIFLSEFCGTAILLLLGAGVVANAILPKVKGASGGNLMINWGWGLAVFSGVLVAQRSGGHLNPAVTVGLALNQVIHPSATGACFVQGAGSCAIPVSAGSICTYIGAQLVGAFVGAFFAWLVYKKHFDEPADPGLKLGVFSTGPAIRNYAWNLVTEAFATFVLVFVVLAAGHWGDSATNTPGGLGWLGALGVALLIVGIGTSLGGPTGYAINPARDLGPRIFYAIISPFMKNGHDKPDWAYSWVPIVGPLVGGLVAGACATFLL